MLSSKATQRFLYDRLGGCASDHPDPSSWCKEYWTFAIGHELVLMLRAGDVADTLFKHVVGVRRSLAITNYYPDDSDAAVLTGFSTSTTGIATAFVAADLTIA